ncbi:MAG: hypothetical protein Q9222_000643 [Ikaeria aurantiellina]
MSKVQWLDSACNILLDYVAFDDSSDFPMVIAHTRQCPPRPYNTNTPSNPKAPAPTPIHAPVCLEDPPVTAAEFGSAPPPAPPPASDEPVDPSVCVPELSSPVEEAIALPDVLVAIMSEPEVGVELIIMLELSIMDEDIIIMLEPVIMAESIIVEESSIIVAEAAVGLLVSRLAMPFGPAEPTAAPPMPP